MRHLYIWFNILIKKRKELRRWQKIVTVLAAIITFATTYALILPAITVERDNTENVGGMYLEQEEAQEDLFEENALEFTGVSIAADQENAVTYEYADDNMTATAVFSTDEEIPEGTELVVNPVDTESEEYADLSRRSLVLLDKEFIYDVTTCSFYKFALICDGVDVTPKTGLVDVQINFINNTVEHVDDSVYAGRFGRPADVTEGFAAMSADYTDETADVQADTAVAEYNDLADSADLPNVGDELVSSNPDESSAIELNESIITVLSLKGSDLALTDNVVGILAGNVDEEAKAAAAETDAEIPDDDVSQEDTPANPAEDEGEAAPYVKTLKANGDDYTVVLTYDESSKIPEGAYLTASEISQDSKEYKTYLEETKKAMGLTEEETLPRFAARFFDIKIMVGDDEFTPKTGVSVEITYAEPLAEKADAEVSAVHFADKKADAEVIEANTTEVQDDGAATVEFTAESFSVYGVIYTVDFEYEDHKWSWPGKGSYSIASILAEVGINDTVTNVALQKVFDAGGTDNALYLEKKEDGWYLTSDVAFHDIYELSVTCGEKVYLISVSDADSSDLTAFITNVNINAPLGTDGKYEVRKGKPVTIDLSFKEKSALQFDLNQMTYPIPAGLDAVEGAKGYLTISATDGDDNYEIDGNEYEVKDGVLILKWNKDHPDFEHLAASKNTEFTLHISASLDGSKNTINFGGNITKEFKIDDPHGVSVQKSSFNLNKVTGEIEYLVTVTSTGDNTNIVVTDSSSQGKALSHVPGTVKVYNNKDDRRDATLVSGVNVTNDTSNGFSLTIPSMADGQTYAIVYKGQIDLSKLTKNSDGSYGIDTDTVNNVRAKPDGDIPEDSATHTEGKIFAKPEVSKKAGTASDVVDGKRTVEWTMTATSVNTPNDHSSSLAGGWIKDTIDNTIIPGTNKTSQEIMKYSGSGIRVVITNENNQIVETRNISWSELGVNPSTNTSWTYYVPNEGVDKNTNGKLTYTITYTTEVDVSEMISDIEVKNTGDSDKGEPYTGKGGVGPVDGNEAGVDKKVIKVDQEEGEVEWQVDITVPATGLTYASLEDIYPRQWDDDNAPYDTLKGGSIEYIGLLNGEGGVTEDKTENTTDPKKMVITFSYSDSTGNHPGLKGTGTQRVVTVKFKTKNNAGWINDTLNNNGNRNHVNTARFTGNQKVFTDTATAVPTMEQKVTKRADNNGLPSGKVNVNGVDLPVWTYELVLEGVLPDSEITDTFDDRLVFVPFDVVDFGNSTNQPGVLYGGMNSNDMQSYVGNWINTYGTKLDGYVDAVSSGNEVTFHINKDNIPRYSYNDGTTNVENQFFKIIYQLRVKDEASLESLMAEAAAESDKTLKTIRNTAIFGPSSDELNVKYKYSPVTKELINSGEIGGLNNIAKFKVVVNPSGLDLDPNSDFITLTDQIVENLSVEYDSISASPSQGVKWTFSGNTATYTVPDGIPVTITYNALIIGNGNIHFRNEATVDGEIVFVDETKNVQSKAEGSSTNPTIKVKKHKEGEMTTPLAGAEFQLYEFVCIDGKTPDDCWRTEVPNTNPVVHGLDRTKLEKAIQSGWGSWQPVKSNNDNDIKRTTDSQGVASFRGDMKNEGWALSEGELYSLHETIVPDGYVKEDIYWSFVISENGVPYYDYGIYHSGDAMRIANMPEPGITIEKEILGANLTEEQKAAIIFEITDPDNNKTTLNFNQFTHGEYRLTGERFKRGTYTIVEKTTPPEGYDLNTSVLVGETEGTVTKNGSTGEVIATATITIPNDETALTKDYTVSFLNKYSSASINVVKIGEKAEYLEGAVFELFKKNTETGEEVSKGQKVSTGDAEGLLYDCLEDGDYVLKEVTPPEGYIKLASDMNFKIVDGAVQWIGEDTPSGSVSYKPSTKTVTVLNREDTQVRVNKVWAGEDDRATPVTMQLYRTSHPMPLKTVPYRDNQNIFGTITYPSGATIKAYFINENGQPDTAVIQDSNSGQIHISQNNISNVRLEIILPADIEGSKRLVATKSTENNTVLFEGLDRTDPGGNLYTYWVEEETPTGRYTVSYDNKYVTHNSTSKEITVTNTPEEEEEGLIEVEKVWKNADGSTISDMSELPEISVKLKATAPSGDAVIHCAVNGQRDKFTVSQYEDGTKIQVGDTIILNYGNNQGEVHSVHKGSSSGATITNTSDSGEVKFKVTSTDIYVLFNWLNAASGTAGKDNNGSEPQVPIPQDISITLNNSNHYYWSSEDHPGLLDTDNFAYQVLEEDVPNGYAVTYSTNNEKGITKGKLTVINTKDDTEIEVTKIWKNDIGGYKEWPEDVSSITLKLKKAVGEGTASDYLTLTVPKPTGDIPSDVSIYPSTAGITATVQKTGENASDGYVVKVGGLPSKEGESAIVYSFTEESVESYTTTYSFLNENGPVSSGTTKESADNGEAIVNVPFTAVALPNTGGPGTRLFTILGSILILGAGVLLWRRRRLI